MSKHWNSQIAFTRRWRTAIAFVFAVVAVLVPTTSSLAQGATQNTGGTWTALSGVPNFQPDAVMLLANGSVIVSDQSGPNATDTGLWYKLTPSPSGSYVNGTWQEIASTPTGYEPMNAGTGILPNGDFIIEGGDNNGTAASWTNQGAIYDPNTNTWTSISPPDGGTGQFAHVGDAPSVMLADGTFLFGPSGGCGVSCPGLSPDAATNWLQQDVASFNQSNETWNVISPGDRIGSNAESGFTLLPDGNVLTVPTYLPSLGISEILNTTTDTWSSQPMPESLLLPVPSGQNNDGEIGPMVLLPDGNVFAEGDNGNTELFNTATQTWSDGPAMPVIDGITYTAADAPAAVLPDGDVLMDLSPYETTGQQDPPAHFFLFNGTTITQISDPPSAANTANCASYCGFFTDLPNGQVLFENRSGPTSFFVYTPSGTASTGSQPVVTSAPSLVEQGVTFSVTGSQLSGISTGSAYGDDWNAATDFPIAQLTATNGDVYYASTSTIASYSVAPNNVSTSQFVIPSTVPDGTYTMRIVANGVSSAPVNLVVGMASKVLICAKGAVRKRIVAVAPRCPNGFHAVK